MDWQPAGDAFSALCDATPAAQTASPLVVPDLAETGRESQVTPAKDAAGGRAAARLSAIHRHSAQSILVFALPEATQLPTVQVEAEPNMTQPDLQSVEMSDEPTLAVIPTVSLSLDPLAPKPAGDAAVAIAILWAFAPGSVSGQTRSAMPFDGDTCRPVVSPATLSPADASRTADAHQGLVAAMVRIAPRSDPAMPTTLSQPGMAEQPLGIEAREQIYAESLPGVVPDAGAALDANQVAAVPSHPTPLNPAGVAAESPVPVQFKAPFAALPQSQAPALYVGQVQSANNPKRPLDESGAMTSVSLLPAMRNSGQPFSANIPPVVAWRDAGSAVSNPLIVPPLSHPEILSTFLIPAALRSHLEWRAGGKATDTALPHVLSPASTLAASDAPPALSTFAVPNDVRTLTNPSQPEDEIAAAAALPRPQNMDELHSVSPTRSVIDDEADYESDPAPVLATLSSQLPTATYVSRQSLATGDIPAQIAPPMPASRPAVVTHVGNLKSLAGGIVRAAARPSESDRTELNLDPTELGRLRFTVVAKGDQVQVSLAVERPETLDLLRRHVGELRAELQEQGFANPALSFGQWGQDQPNDPPQTAAEFSGSLLQADPETTVILGLPAAGLDLRL